MNADLVPDPKAAIAFLELLHPGGPWILTAITPDGPTTTETFYKAAAVPKWIERQNADRNIYWMPAEATGPLRKKATKDDIARTFLLWADLDGISDPSRLNGHAPAPTTIVASGGGLNLYWALSEPIDDKDEIEARNRWLAQHLGADACWNCDRILRLPGTINWPNKKKRSTGRVPVLARCIEHHPERLDDFDDFGRIEGGQAKEGERVDLGEDIEFLTLDGLPAEVREKLHAATRRLIGEGQRPDEYRGDRSKAVWAVVCALVRVGASDAQIAGILLNPKLAIHAHVADQKGHGPRAYVARQIERAREHVEKEAPPREGAGKGRAKGTRPNGNPDEWPDPAPLPEGLPAVQPFDPLLLPDHIRPWLTDIAERMQVPLDFPAIAAMVGLGSVVGRQMGIRPKLHDDWTVVPNLFGGIVGRPGLLKTPALQEACRPLIRLEMAAKDEFTLAQAEYEAKQRISKQKKKLQDDKITRDLKGNRDPKGILHDLLAAGNEEPPPARRRYLVNDSTIEKLSEILSTNPNGVLIFRDELTGFLRQMDREGREQDRAFYLEAWNGTGRFTYDRIGRGTIDIEACCVCLLGGIQPGPLTAYLENMVHGGAGDDGLIQRLQLLVWPDVSGAWVNVDRGPDSAARAGAEGLFDGLSILTTSSGHAGGIPFLRFDAAAQDAFDQWRAALERSLRAGELHPALESHLAKYRSLIPSIALLCHLVDSGPRPVGIVSLKRSLAWGEYLESHARRVYDALIRSDLCAARSLGEHILAGDLTSPFALRDVYRPGWSGVSTLDAAAEAVGVLLDLKWLLAEEIKAGPVGGRSTTCYHINPKAGRGP